MRCFIGTLIMLCSFSLYAAPSESTQNTKSNKRLTTGLVLSGGGARGIAHVGVIKALEEMGIKVDAVVGTSAGSIIGALYASGMTADELADTVEHIDWKGGFTDSSDRSEMPMRRKQEDYKLLLDYHISVKDGEVKLPRGAVQGQHLNLMLKELFQHVENIEDFDQLPIPYRAVASDIVTGDRYVFNHGSLSTATRASMAIPGVYSPVEFDGHVLVDGGIASNLPVEVAQAMNVDRLIVVDISTPLKKKDEIDSFFAVSDQVLTILTQKNTAASIASMGKGDILIQPKLEEVSTFSFDQIELAFKRGYEATMALQPQLSQWAEPEAIDHGFVITQDAPRIDFIEVDNNSAISDKLIRARLDQNVGEAFDRDLLMENIANIYSLDYFRLIDYQLVKKGDQTGLKIITKERKWGANYIRIGGNFADDVNGKSEYNLGISYRLKGINKLGAEAYVFGQIGNKMAFETNFYQPLDYSSNFYVEPYFKYRGKHIIREFDVLNLEGGRSVDGFATDDGKEQDWWVKRGTFGFDLGSTLLNSIDMRVGVFTASGGFKPDGDVFSEDTYHFNEGGYRVQTSYDSMDNVSFPSKGFWFNFVGEDNKESMGSDDEFKHIIARLGGAYSLGDHTLSAELGTEQYRSADLEPQYMATLGGFRRLSGYSSDALAGAYSAMGRIQYRYRLTDRSMLPVDFPAYFGATFEAGNVWDQRSMMSTDDLIHAGSIYLALDSPIGAMYFAYGRAEGSQSAFYLSIGESY
ncbi:NTE family protein [Sinobacterium caligoides]|uniref:NTE family protein n=1 Tax=Sinobacterium caligoides TaxID=933926 RepID=A0A3N2DZ04_9GAMM|nr:patatin-like phospholipase family protein [Sinobacterium caligoides]ROS05034.1 NTE family protein [Sinobacterium caligoides]